MAEEEMAEGEDYAGAQGDELDDIDEATNTRDELVQFITNLGVQDEIF